MKEMVEHQQILLERGEEGDKERRRRRRSNKKPKQNHDVSDCSLIDEMHEHEPATLENGGCSNSPSGLVYLPLNNHETSAHKLERLLPTKASDVSFNSLPNMHIDGEAIPRERGVENRIPFLLDMERVNLAGSDKSCPVSMSHEKENEYNDNEGYSDTVQGNVFPPHWPVCAVNAAIERGDAFRAVFRVNAHNRLEAYCTIDGVPTDILISGFHAQNRAIEGDTVAIALEPLSSWTKLRGFPGRSCTSLTKGDSNMFSEASGVVISGYQQEDLEDSECKYSDRKGLVLSNGSHHVENTCGVLDLGTKTEEKSFNNLSDEQRASPDTLKGNCTSQEVGLSGPLGNLCAMISSFPSKRPTGKVLAITDWSSRRNAIIGFLGVKQWLPCRSKDTSGQSSKRAKSFVSFPGGKYIQLTPTDARFPKMLVSVKSLPEFIQHRLYEGDETVEKELVAAKINSWKEDCFLPHAHVIHIFGRGGEMESQIAAILFENAISLTKFSSESVACLPNLSWTVPKEELERRMDLRNLCVFTIDPSTAAEIDDALSVERVSNDVFRVGVHISDVTYFVQPDTSLDIEAQMRSTSVYLLQHKISMLPPLLSENMGSLIPGVQRLTFSIIWDINLAGDILDRWIGHTVIHSCCKLSYEQVQGMIDGTLCVNTTGDQHPKLHGQFEWHDVINSVKVLHEISKRLKDNRFKEGALSLENSRLVFMFDQLGMPYDSALCERMESNYLVEEYMLLANRTAAEIISRAFPDCALLRRHPEPNVRKLREFELFCSKHGFELDISSSGQIQLSLRKIREKLKNDQVLYDILVSYASKPMQLAAYFCTGNLRDQGNDWAHYSLAIPVYTHFTSPLRRYPDIIVHRTLSAALEAEQIYLQQQLNKPEVIEEDFIFPLGSKITRRFYSGLSFDKYAVESKEFKKVLSVAALKHRVPGTRELAEFAAHCNERKLASKHAEDASERVCIWAMLKKKEMLVSDARVLGLGPKFMSVYVQKLAMEKRIYYDEVEGLYVEWLETTSTLVLDLHKHKRFPKRIGPGKYRTINDVAVVVNPSDLASKEAAQDNHNPEKNLEVNDPVVFPLTLQILSSVPVALHAMGGDGKPVDISAKLYMSSYFR